MFTTVEHADLKKTILKCYTADPSIQAFSRNNEHGLEERTQLEVNGLMIADSSFQFYDIYEGEELVGYYGKETFPVTCLTTFFIMPEYRKRKSDVWQFIVSQMPGDFFAGLFKINERAIKFFEDQGGIYVSDIVAEHKPSVVYFFKR